MVKQYTIKHEVAYYECDFNQDMTVPSLIAVAIKTSEEQSDLLDRGSAYVLEKYGLAWVITNYTISVKRMPKVGEVVSITTQAMEYNKYFCYRNFWFKDSEDNELVKIEAVFVLMDFEQRKMSSVNEDIIAPYDSEKIKKIKRQPKIEKIEQSLFKPYRVRFFDIDANHHVNNAVYFTWMIDVLGYDFLITHKITSMVIRFDKEVEYGHEVESHYELIQAEAGTKSKHQIKIGNQVYAEAMIDWQ